MLPSHFLESHLIPLPMHSDNALAALTLPACRSLFLCHSMGLMFSAVYAGSLDVMLIVHSRQNLLGVDC